MRPSLPRPQCLPPRPPLSNRHGRGPADPRRRHGDPDPRRAGGRASGADGPARRRGRLHAVEIRLPRRRGRPGRRPARPPAAFARLHPPSGACRRPRPPGRRRDPRIVRGNGADTPRRPADDALRAITPPGRSRRFDARFFLADAADVSGDAEGFSDASAELSHLHWIGLAEARALDLPFITEVVLAEVTNLLTGGTQPGVPFFDNSGPVPTFRRID